jgi:hypothetical protein
MRYVRKFAVLLVVLYLVTLLSGADQFISSAIADSPQPLVIRTVDGEETVGSVQVLCGGSDYSIAFDVDDPYEIYSSIVTFRFNSGGVTRVKSFGLDDDCVEKTKTRHCYSVPAELIKGDDVQIAASAMVKCDGKTYLTPKVFANLQAIVPTPVTTIPEIVPTTTPVPPVTAPHHHGGGAVVTTTTSPAVTPTTVHRAVATTTTTQVPATTTTTVPQITTTTTVPVITTTTKVTPPKPRPRPRLPYTGSEHNWYMIGALLLAAGLMMWTTSAIDSRLSRRSKNTE